ncbi:acetyl-CoA carboxylase carboxyltransferase subunit alpha [Romboutsia weinsteinii]|uniref:Acetyl-coenzyme A carboxylase carboxyl transferase subunit alpha n=1 Tax=Romboutsia weinsteinii TaxID=2020949 RepID=A0A371J6P1_9FIRM|nr:acetyl-CoA carboxylase carboxyltransferase subunit alpha [Romboutsia weinsteinii]RDY28338.1 acetyl-CoA carboxylase carboxyltransferase subunit alpha [Romboutsia weinsteinii]
MHNNNLNLSPYDRVVISRDIKRPTTQDYINLITSNFIELHGDRMYRDDPSIVAGIGKIGKHSVTIIGHQKGNNLQENIERNFGMPHPEGYRKALRLMKQAEKFNRPIITFIDTPGAYCGLEAEKRGQGEAIARNLLEMSKLSVPIITFVIGEGGSGGALGIGVGNKICMLENSIYSVISPEGLSSILFKDSSKSKEASEVMKLTSYDLYNLNIVDKIIKEPIDGAQKDVKLVADNIKLYILEELGYYENISKEEIISQRYNKFREIGRCL